MVVVVTVLKVKATPSDQRSITGGGVAARGGVMKVGGGLAAGGGGWR